MKNFWKAANELFIYIYIYILYMKSVYIYIYIYIIYEEYIQTRFQKSWDTVQIVNKKGMQ